MKKGDKIAVVAKPVAKTIDFLVGTDLQNCAGCNQMQLNLNNGMSMAQAIRYRWWPETEEEKSEKRKAKNEVRGSKDARGRV
jgi:hypothetical protein